MKALAKEDLEKLLQKLQHRFQQNEEGHRGLKWEDVEKRLRENPHKASALSRMEDSGGEPDVVGYNKSNDEYLIYDCCKESPIGRRSLCYDEAALKSRKQNKPKGSAVEMAMSMGVNLLTEQEYRNLQKLGDIDTKTSSWIHTPTAIREKGGALFCDNRYGQVFVYHNGAESYYAARGFRTCLKL